jgi:Domain of unknown function (DUF303).
MLIFATTALAQEKHVYLAFGQSNMRGPGPIRASDKENIPDNLQVLNIMTGIYGGTSTNNGGIQRNKGEWYKAIPPLIIRGNLQHWQGQFTIGLGPADWFGRTVYANKPANVSHIGIIPVAGGSLALGAFHKALGGEGAGGYFASGQGGTYRESGRPDATERSEGQVYITESGYASLYDAVISNAKKAQSEGWIVKGIIVHQGESGRGLNYANWGTILKDIYNDMLADLGLAPNSIPILCGQTFNGGSGNTGGALANDAAIQAFIPNAYIISSAGCGGRPTNDNTHFGSEGQQLLGTRYGEKMVQLVYGSDNGIDDIFAEDKEPNIQVSVQQNSAVKVDFVATGNGKTDLKLFSINGDLVASTTLQTIAGESGSYSFDQGNLSSGFYIVQMHNNGSIEGAKAIIF